MGFSANMEIDTSEFDRAMAKYLEVNKREFQEIVNYKAKAIAFDSLYGTRAADVDKMRHLFGQVATRITAKKTGRRLKTPKPVYAEDDTFIHRVVVKRMKLRGQKIPPREELNRIVKKERSRRMSGSGFIKSGWIPAAAKYQAETSAKGFVKKSGKRPRKYGVDKGGARPATRSFNPVAWLWNSALAAMTVHSWKPGRPEKAAREGLQMAVNLEAASMVEYVRKKLAKNAKRFSAA